VGDGEERPLAVMRGFAPRIYPPGRRNALTSVATGRTAMTTHPGEACARGRSLYPDPGTRNREPHNDERRALRRAVPRESNGRCSTSC
jgi:hypothetical protein